MVDFNTKKNILKKLRKVRTENKLLWLPCVIAAAFVKLWYGTVCRIGMALSDRNGNFLGIKMPERQPKSRRQDDIVYVKKPFIGRIMSAILAAAFVLMVAPELNIDFGITASAVTVTTFPVEIGGVMSYDYVSIDGSSTRKILFLESERLVADSYGITDFKYKTAYGKMNLSWKINAPIDAKLISGYRVIIKAGNEEIYNSVESFSTAEVYDFIPNIQPSQISKTIDNDCRVSVYPLTKIYEYDYTETTTADGVVQMVNKRSSPNYAYESSKGISEQSVGKLNATFDPPTLRILNENGEDIDDCSIAECNSQKIKLTWNQVPQIGGTEPNSAPDGYVIYRYDVNTKQFTETLVTATTFSVNNITPGARYQFFVEAYRNVWGSGYNKNNSGIISSSKGDINTSGDNKLNGIYSGYAKTLYIAPPTPDLKIDDTNPKDKSIKVSWDSTKGNYAGVDVYRSIGRIDPDKIPEVKDETISFREWLEQQAEYSSDDYADYKIVKVGDFAKPGTKVYTGKIDGDSTVAEGVQYYYYAIAYTQKDNLSYIYGVPAIKPAKLELKLNRPQLTATKGDGEVNLSWTAVEGADGYDVEIIQKSKYDPVKKEVVALATPITSTYKQIEKTFLKLDGLYNGEQYTYKVTPYVWIETKDGDIPYYGDPSDPRTVTVGLGLDRPENLVADGSKDGQMTIKWNPVPNATGYTLYYKNTSDETQTKFKEISTQKPTYTQTNLNNGDVYEYYVIAYKNVNIDGEDGIQITYSEESEHAVAKVGIALGTPQDLKTTTKDGEITVTWTPVAGANGYKLHYKNVTKGTSGEFEVTKPPFTHTGLQNGDVYEYYVTPYKTMPGTGKDIPGPTSLTVTQMVGTVLDAPKDFLGTTKDGVINLTWTAVKGAEGYELYFRKNGGSWEKIDVSKPGFQHTGLKNGDSYEYYVKAYKTVNGVRVYSDATMSNHLYFTVGEVIDAPKDFTVTTGDGKADMKWTAVKGAEGYIIHASSGGRYYQFDVSKVTYTHSDLSNGDIWTYYVTAYKTVNGTRTYSNPSEPKTVTIGISLSSAVDLTATAGNRQIDLKWTAVNGAEGYVVYLYNSKTMEFEPITVTSKTNYSHVGLKNGRQYTYMVAPYKTINGKRFYGDYSLSVTAIPTTGSITDMDHELNVKGTAPYGISHSEYISAVSNHGAFDESVDVYFTTNRESTQAVKDVLKNYANGLKSFIIYPFDISIYRENTHIEVDPADGYTVTVTMPVPDRLIAYRDYITVVHIGSGDYESEEMNLAEDWFDNYDRRLEVLPCAIVDIDNVWCVQFKCSSFSPYALVIYKEHIQDVASGGGLLDDGFTDTFNSGLLLFTALPDIMPHNRKLRIVQSGSKRYRIKSVTKK